MQKSIEARSIVEINLSRGEKIEKVFGYIFSMITSLLFLAFSGFVFYQPSILQSILLVAFSMISLILGLLGVFGVLQRDRLYEIRGTNSLERNKIIAKKALNEVFRRNTFLDTGDIWTSKRTIKHYVGEKSFNRVTIIFSANRIFFNAELFAQNQFQSPFYPAFYYLKYLRLKKIIESVSH